MSSSTANAAPNWNAIRLVVFDVDGTLYDQRGLRMRMLQEMLGHAVRARSIDFIRTLRVYRHVREQLGEELRENFESELLARTVRRTGGSPERVKAIAEEWLEQRPLRHLVRYRYANLPALFEGLRTQGKIIGIFSDYPARRKIEALQLQADFIVCAGDAEVGVLKPHARGLQLLMCRAGVTAPQTLMIGDRAERDGLAAQAANVPALIRSRKSIAGWQTFSGYDEAVFSALLA